MLRYYSYRQHLRETFAFPVKKICIDAGFTCPNRDGTKGYGGCIYCNDRGSGAPYIDRRAAWELQFSESAALHTMRDPGVRFLVYFQAFSNTYASVDVLEILYRRALRGKGVVGLVIGTRPDCITPEILDLIAELSSETYLWLELGLESIHDRTLKLVNRQHTFQDFLSAYQAVREREIKTGIHIINGLPGESVCDILQTAQTVGQLEPDGVKMHSLYIEKRTQLFNLYQESPWHIFSEDDYVEIAARCIEYMPEATVIQRLVGEAAPGRLFAPRWTLNKQKILRAVNDKLCEWDSHQGAKFVPGRSVRKQYFPVAEAR